MRPLLFVIGLLAVLPAAQARRWVTVLGETTLARAQVGVVARVDDVLEIPARRITVLRLAVEKTIWGKTDQRLLNVIVADLGIGARKGRRLVVFLRPLRRNQRVVNMFYLDSEEAEQKLKLLREHIALERLPAESRDKAHRALILDGLASADDWQFYNTMMELTKRIRDTGGFLEPAFRKRVSRLAFTLKQAKRKQHLRRLLVGLPVPSRSRKKQPPRQTGGDPKKKSDDPSRAPLTAGDAMARARDARGAARERALVRLAGFPGAATEGLLIDALGASEARARMAAAFSLGQLRPARAAKPLILALQRERSAAAACQQLRALGLLRSAEAVPAVARRLAATGTCQEALLALARIRTPEAMKRLRAFVAGAAAQAPYPALVRLARYYQSAEFEQRDGAGRSR